jgi:diguanylate cyclase (GGDEF)-like protein/PAS domain S-box-containing protein
LGISPKTFFNDLELGFVGKDAVQIGNHMIRATLASNVKTENDAGLRTKLEHWSRITPAMLHAVDIEGRLILVSDFWLAKFGYEREQVIGKLYSDFLTPASRERAKENVSSKSPEYGHRENAEYQMVCGDGRVVEVLLSAIPLDGAAGSGCASLAVVADITAHRAVEQQLAESAAGYEKPIEDRPDTPSLANPKDAVRFLEADQRLKESEARYRLLAENSTDLILLVGLDGTRLYASPACRTLLGFEPEEMLRMSARESIHPEDVGMVMGRLANVAEERGTLRYRLRRKDGSYVWVESVARTVFGGPGQPPQRLVVARDIAERVAAEQRLKESEARYRLLAENSTDIILLVGLDGTRLYASPACRTLLGYEPEEMLRMSTQESIHPEDLAIVQERLQRWDEPTTVEYRLRRKDGSYIWVESVAHPIDDPGKPPHLLVVSRDIEQRVVAEQRLRDSEVRYRLLADHSTDMVFQLDLDLVRRYVSPACREILGYEPEDLIGCKPLSLVHLEDAEHVAQVYRSLLDTPTRRQSVIYRIRHRDGRWIWVEAQLRTLEDAQTGAPCGIIGALRDISIRKAVEEQLAEANRRLEALAGQDALTGLANRRAFDDALSREYKRAKRDRGRLALIMIDVDFFKSFNDHYGHPAGDECLRRVSGAIGSAIRRPSDLAARYGGEEFAVLLPDTDEAGAAQIADRIRQNICRLELKHHACANSIVTVSAGVASVGRDDFEAAPEALVQSADRALYRAKDSGRNNVIHASSLPRSHGAKLSNAK